MKDVKPDHKFGAWFLVVLVYLFVDYGRPQDLVPVIGGIKPGMIVILLLTAFLVFSMKIRESDCRQTRLIWAFIILLSLYVPFAVNNFLAYKAVENMLLFMPFILSVCVCVQTFKQLKALLLFLILLMSYVAGYSLLHGGVGSGNYFQDENDLSLYINMYLPFCFFLLLAERSVVKKIVYGVALVIGVAAVIASLSRGGFVGLVCTAFIAWLYSPRKIVSLVFLGLAALVIYSAVGESYWQEMATSQDLDKGTAVERIESWKSGWNMFIANPLGVGGNNFTVRFPEYQTEYFQRGMWGRQAHSLWFTLLPEVGVVGVVIYLSLLYANLRDIFSLGSLKSSGEEFPYGPALSTAFIASLAGYFSSGTFLSVLYYPHYWYLTGIIVATVKVAKRMNTNGMPDHVSVEGSLCPNV